MLIPKRVKRRKQHRGNISPRKASAIVFSHPVRIAYSSSTSKSSAPLTNPDTIFDINADS